jgi:hypothetical protein
MDAQQRADLPRADVHVHRARDPGNQIMADLDLPLLGQVRLMSCTVMPHKCSERDHPVLEALQPLLVLADPLRLKRPRPVPVTAQSAPARAWREARSGSW